MAGVTDATHVRSVPGELCYVAPESPALVRFVTPANTVKTGIYRQYQVPIHNGRPIQDQFTLDRNGFAIIEHRSAVRDFTDPGELNRIYAGEIADLVKSRTGADRVAPLGWVLRESLAPDEHASQRSAAVRPQAIMVHDDFSVSGARKTVAAAYAGLFPDGRGYRRALFASLWRVISPPPQDWPLALCDHTSVGPGEALDCPMYFVDKAPDDLYAEMPPDTLSTSGVEFHYSPAHRWWYFPDMTRDEILFFKFDDTDHSVAWRTAHSAFRDQTVQATQPRRSIEFRTVAYFE
jgi:hypothetical protein